MFNPALLALEASDGTVVLTSITLVFAMLVALCLIITLEGKIFDALAAKKNPPKAPKAPAAPASKPAAPAGGGSVAQAAVLPAGAIAPEIVAAIAAAVAVMEGDGAVIRGIRRISTPASGNRRGAWGQAGVREHTTPFM